MEEGSPRKSGGLPFFAQRPAYNREDGKIRIENGGHLPRFAALEACGMRHAFWEAVNATLKG